MFTFADIFLTTPGTALVVHSIHAGGEGGANMDRLCDLFMWNAAHEGAG